MKVRPYRLLEHTADIRLGINGVTLRALFQNALLALTDTLTDLQKVRSKTSRRIRIRGDGPEQLLVHFLKELLFWFDARRFLSRRLAIQRLDDRILEGTVYGEVFGSRGVSRNAPTLKTEIKAVTYHGLKVEKKRGRWVAEVILDV